jgi:hypothetical protein
MILLDTFCVIVYLTVQALRQVISKFLEDY